MKRKPCLHSKSLPKGLMCNNKGHLLIRIWIDKKIYLKGCGKHTPETERSTRYLLNKLYVQKHEGTFQFPDKVDRKKFSETCDIYFEYFKNRKMRSLSSIYNMTIRLNQFKTVFGDKWFDEIKFHDIMAWRKR